MKVWHLISVLSDVAEAFAAIQLSGCAIANDLP
jgi:hypothetical protein